MHMIWSVGAEGDSKGKCKLYAITGSVKDRVIFDPAHAINVLIRYPCKLLLLFLFYTYQKIIIKDTLYNKHLQAAVA